MKTTMNIDDIVIKKTLLLLIDSLEIIDELENSSKKEEIKQKISSVYTLLISAVGNALIAE